MDQSRCKIGQKVEEHPCTFVYTRHAKERIDSRRIPVQAIYMVIQYGRKVFTRGAMIFAIGHKEVSRFLKQGIQLRDYEGIQVVCSSERAILTAYRNHDFRSLRPTKRHKC